MPDVRVLIGVKQRKNSEHQNKIIVYQGVFYKVFFGIKICRHSITEIILIYLTKYVNFYDTK